MYKSYFFIFFSVVIFGMTSAIQRRWLFPNRPTAQVSSKLYSREAIMGVPDPTCDDAKTNLTRDWNNSYLDYTCFKKGKYDKKQKMIDDVIEFETIPPNYMAPHICMNQSISYDSSIPTYGPHRPLWARWGTFKYLPKQRWLHNLEHGGIAALYHPCADKYGILKLQKLVRGCLRKHIISPSQDIPFDKPFVLVAWGVKLRMKSVNESRVEDFIKRYALKGYESTPLDGQFTLMFEKPAEIVSDINDKNLCPKSIKSNSSKPIQF